MRIIKRSIKINGHQTSVSLEDAFWDGLKGIAVAQATTVSALAGALDISRTGNNLSSAIRLFVLEHFRSMIPPHIAASAGITLERKDPAWTQPDEQRG